MPRFPEIFIQQVLQATDIVELVSQYVALKQKGREFVGLCPFHNDKNPSLNVSPGKQIFKCFACGAGGNAMQFVMGYEKMTFPEAVQRLAEQANIPLPKEYESASAPGGMSKNDLTAVTEFAADFFREQLRGPAGQVALNYARQRGLSQESIERFGIGFAPDSWEAFVLAGRKKGYSDQQLITAGLVRRRDGERGCYDYFRNRLMFPIHDLTGRVVGFGGRALAPEERAKYLNSPESVLFEKSSLLYGLHFAREAIVKSKQAVVVEGYLDALIPLQEGVKNVVATLGTALTERHARLLGRYASEAVLIFDADDAGAAAAERALQLFIIQKLHVRVATISEGKDPCDFCLAQGPDALQTLVDDAPDALKYVWDRRREALRSAGSNPAERNRLIEEFLNVIVSSGAYGAIDGVRQQSMAQYIAHIVNVPAIDLQQRMRRLARHIPRSSGARRPGSPPPGKSFSPSPERHILEILLDRPDLFDDVARQVDLSLFNDAELAVIAERIWAMGEDGRLSLEDLLAVEEMADFAPLLTELSITAQRRGNHEQTLTDAVAALLNRQENREMQEIKAQPMDDENLRRLQERFGKTDPRKRPGIQ